VFVPTAFVPGITGRLYQQFEVTIAISVLLSAFNALTLSPALAALLLRPKQPSRGLLSRFFSWFNRTFERANQGYVHWSAVLIQKSAVVIVLLVGCGVAAGFFASRVPSSFLPDEDQGYLYINMRLPTSASLERTGAVAADAASIAPSAVASNTNNNRRAREMLRHLKKVCSLMQDIFGKLISLSAAPFFSAHSCFALCRLHQTIFLHRCLPRRFTTNSAAHGPSY
jgi:hypothetical protein